jgi:hypothetical protein
MRPWVIASLHKRYGGTLQCGEVTWTGCPYVSVVTHIDAEDKAGMFLRNVCAHLP